MIHTRSDCALAASLANKHSHSERKQGQRSPCILSNWECVRRGAWLSLSVVSCELFCFFTPMIWHCLYWLHLPSHLKICSGMWVSIIFWKPSLHFCFSVFSLRWEKSRVVCLHFISYCVYSDRLCGLVVRVPDYRKEYCVSCEVRIEFIYVM
jgi:hypothetical protein